MNGFFNRLLRVDLSAGTFGCEEIPDEVLSRTLGGKGLGTYLLWNETRVGVPPLSPENRFILTTGPVTGTSFWSQSRFGAFAKGPATGGFAESYCGGTLAPKIKGCGVDAIVLEGACDSLSFLIIDESGVRFADAEPIRGADTCRSEEYILRKSPPGSSAMSIGPAGENLVAFACVKADRWRSLGRCGLGAVLGSKNVKGIAFSGGRKAPLADADGLRILTRQISQQYKNSPMTAIYRKLGTPMQVAVTNTQNCFPTRYWQSGHLSNWERISADYMQENFDINSCGCPNCFLKCTKLSRIRQGRHRGLELEGPEYETIFALGGLNEIDSLEEIAYLNDLCDRLGLDTISAGNISSFAIEARRRGKIDFAIDYGQPERCAELYRLISRQDGVGKIFGKGIKPAAAELGLEKLAVHVKGLEPAGFDPRVLKGMALSYATSARGACHLRGTFYKAELTGQVDRNVIPGKALQQIDYEDRAALFDCLILCRFYRDFIPWETIGAIIETTTGVSQDRKGLELLANDVTERTREYNRREGLGAATDTLPWTFLNEKTAEGASLAASELELMINEYNAIRGGRSEELRRQRSPAG
jgi:aldehyde:ferredoxin oxidoreductase